MDTAESFFTDAEFEQFVTAIDAQDTAAFNAIFQAAWQRNVEKEYPLYAKLMKPVAVEVIGVE